MTSQKADWAKAHVVSDFISFSAINGGAIHENGIAPFFRTEIF